MRHEPSKRGRPRKAARDAAAAELRIPSPAQIEELSAELLSAGHTDVPDGANAEAFREWFRPYCERDLFMFCRWVMGFKDLANLHRETCTFLTDFSHTRRKLLMLPLGHLKTSIGSQSLPLHILIQPFQNNLYFPREWGCDQRIALVNESETKCKDNLSVVKEHLVGNPWIAWLWPALVWNNAKVQASRWTDMKIDVRRYRIAKEPSVMAIGLNTGYMGWHYDAAILDDIATIKAGESMDVMGRAKKLRHGIRSRLEARGSLAIEVGLGTHQSGDDVYSEWQRDPTVEVMIRSIVETQVDAAGVERDLPIWPERYSLDKVEQIRATTDPVLWALWYMNKPVSTGFTALEWTRFREFRWRDDCLEFEENEFDEAWRERNNIRKQDRMLKLLMGPPKERTAVEQARFRRYQRKLDPDMVEHMNEKYPKGVYDWHGRREQ